MPPKKNTKSKSAPKEAKVGESRKTKSIADLTPLDRDALLSHVHTFMPLPMREEDVADGSRIFVGGDPGEVLIRVTRTQIKVSVYGIDWEGRPYEPIVRAQSLASLNWKHMPAARLRTNVIELNHLAQQLRRAQYRKCDRCGETKPPEWTHGKDCYQSCAERHLGVVY